MPATPRKKYSKPSGFYANLKSDFFASNETLLNKARAQNAFYLEQPPRNRCKICGNDISQTVDFVSHGVSYVFCRTCDHLNGQKQDTEDFVRRLYLAHGGADYAASYVDGQYEARLQHIYKPKVDFLLETIPLRELGSVLDIGCGAGFFVAACLGLGVPAAGIDVSREMVEFGNAHLEALLGQSPLSRLEEDGFYEAILASSARTISLIGVLEHLREPARFLEAFAACSAEYLFFSVPMASLSVVIENAFTEVFPRHLSGAHTHLFTERSLSWMCNRQHWVTLAEWRFGADAMDLYRSLLTTMRQRGASEHFLDWYASKFAARVDNMQAMFDEQEFCSEIHVLVQKGTRDMRAGARAGT